MNTRLFLIIGFLFLGCQKIFSQVPLFNSLPGASYVVFLDFDGHTVSGTSWNSAYNSGNPIVCAASGYDAAKITEVYNIVAEDYRPFTINVTTDSTIFLAAPVLQKVRIVITPTQSWYPSSAGGVAFLNSFTSASNNVCFAFTGSLANSGPYTAEASSHEAGHTFGLNHHSVYNSSCVKTDEYLQGYGSGEIGWAPIMGVGYYKNMTTWSNIPNTGGCSNAQSDLQLITATNNRGLSLRADDHANNNTGATPLNLAGGTFADSGIITSTADVDVFKLSIAVKSTVNINATPWNYGPANTKANLDILLTLKDATGNNIRINNPATFLNAYISDIILPPGDYFIYIDGVNNINQNGYGSLGKYFITGTTAAYINNTLSANFLASDTNICKGFASNFTDQSAGNITSWNWTFTGGTPAVFTGQNPGNIVYNTAGTYTVALTVSDGMSTDTKTITSYIKINNSPAITIIPALPVVCGNSSTLLTAAGASTYEWAPPTELNNSFLNNVSVFGITADATYTVTGTDVTGCVGSKAVLVKYYPNPVLTKIPASNDAIYICKNDSVSLAVSGANSYVWSPVTGLSSATGANVKAASPNAAALYYNITGTDINGCKGYANFNIIVRSCDSLAAYFTSSGSALCVGENTSFADFSTGTPTEWLWTFYGGTPSTSALQNPGVVTYNTAGSYNVKLVSIKGTDTSTRIAENFVGIANIPVLTITPAAPVICLTDSVNLTAATAQNYRWDANASLSNIYANPVKAKPSSTTKYFVTATNYANGGGGSLAGFKACTSRDSVTVTVNNCSILPIKLLSFEGMLKPAFIQLNWQVQRTENLAGFAVEKSYYGFNFFMLNTIDKKESVLLYEYDDDKITTAGYFYYRIKMMETDGTFTFSNIIKVAVVIKNNEISIWPNPVQDFLNVQIKSRQSSTAAIQINTIAGQTVFTTIEKLTPGNNIIKINTAYLAAGIYILQVNVDGEMKVLKMVKR